MKQGMTKGTQILIIFLIITATVGFMTSEGFKEFINNLEDKGYAGVFVSGIFFSYGLTTLPAAGALYLFSEKLNIFLVAIIGGLGALISDIFLLKLIKIEGMPIFHKSAMFRKVEKKLKKKWIHPFLPAIAGISLALPIPDEAAMTIVETIHLNHKTRYALIFGFKVIGILTIAYLGTL